MVDSYVFVEYRKSYNIFNVAILLLLHLMCLVEFLLDILYFILKIVYIYIYVWANFALGSNSVKGKARPNILCEEIRTSEDDQPRNGRNYHPRRGAAC